MTQGLRLTPIPAPPSTIAGHSTPSSDYRRRTRSTATCSSFAPIRTPTTTVFRSRWNSASRITSALAATTPGARRCRATTSTRTGGLNGTFVDANYPQLEYRSAFRPGPPSHDDDVFRLEARLLRPATTASSELALNGWTVTGIWTANSGQPFTATTGVDNYFSGLGNNRPSIIPGKTPHTLPDNGRSRRRRWRSGSTHRPIAAPELMPVAQVLVLWVCSETRVPCSLTFPVTGTSTLRSSVPSTSTSR